MKKQIYETERDIGALNELFITLNSKYQKMDPNKVHPRLEELMERQIPNKLSDANGFCCLGMPRNKKINIDNILAQMAESEMIIFSYL